MATLSETLGPMLPKISVVGTINFIAWLIIFAIMLIVMAVVIYIVIDRLRYNKKIVIFEKVNNSWQDTRKDRAIELKIGEGGDTIFYLKKNKKYLPRGTIQTGNRRYWYGIREDGEWINIGMEDIDFEMRKAHARFLDKEMRHSRSALQSQLGQRFNKLTFMQRYGGILLYLGLIIGTGVMAWLLFDKMLDYAGLFQSGMEVQKEVLDKLNIILSRMDNLCSGSGIVGG